MQEGRLPPLGQRQLGTSLCSTWELLLWSGPGPSSGGTHTPTLRVWSPHLTHIHSSRVLEKALPGPQHPGSEVNFILLHA